MGEKERSGYQSRRSGEHQSEYKAKYKPSERREYRRDTDKPAKRADQTAKSSNSYRSSKEIFPEYNYQLYSGEAKASSHRNEALESSHFSKSNNSDNRDYVSKHTENKTKSHLTVTRILIQGAVIPEAPPKIILKRKEIYVSPTQSKTSTNLEPRSNIQKVIVNKTPEPEDFEMINESQDLPAVSDETSIELPASRTPPASSINAIEPQTWREPTGELMENGVSKVQSQTTPETTPKGKEEELQPQREPRSVLSEEDTPQDPTQTTDISHVPESGIKSEDSQSIDYEFIENLLSSQLSDEVNTRVSPKEVVIYLQLPITSSQQQQGRIQPHLEDLHDVSYIIMSPTTPDKEDITIGVRKIQRYSKPAAVST